MSNYTFDSDSLKYLLDKLKELFSLKSEADLKVDKVDGKDLVTNDYTDEYAQLNNKIINDITISDKTDTEVTLTFSRKNGDSSSIKIPYDKYKKSALFVDAPEKFMCLANEENKINYRYISSLKDGNHSLVVEIVKSTGTSTNYQESYTYDKIPDYYLYVPDEEDIALRMYFIDSENTMTGITYLEPEAAYLVAEYILNEINDNAYPDCNDGNFTNFATNDTQNDDNTFTRTVLAGKEGPTKIDFRNITGLTKINKIGPSVTNMTNAFSGCSNLTGSSVCGDNVIDMSWTYRNCSELTGNPVCGPNVTTMDNTYRDCSKLTGQPACGPNVTNMAYTYRNCSKLTGNPVCGPNVTDMYATYINCPNLTGSPVCGPNVTDMSSTYAYCPNLTGQPACGDNVTNMSLAYANCTSLTGSPVCGPNVTDMDDAYRNCISLTGSPVCGPNVTNMAYTYRNCSKLTGNPVCGDNVTNMWSTYHYCNKLIGPPVCGNNVFDMTNTYAKCHNLAGQPVCGDNVTNMSNTYIDCWNLTGNPVCGNNVTNMSCTYWECSNLTGNPVCGDKVIDMGGAYKYCYNITGSPVCGPKVTTMTETYYECTNLTGNPVCGDNVIAMDWTYYNCYNLTGAPVCGYNVDSMFQTYYNCRNLSSNAYFYSNKITYAVECFGERNTDKRLNLYVPENSTTLTTCLSTSSSDSLTGTDITWTNDMSTNRCYYNTAQNIYIYPVANVEDVRNEHMYKVLMYSAKNSNAIPTIEGLSDFNIKASAVKQSTVTTTPIQLIVTKEQHNTGTMPEYSTIVDSLPEAVNEVNTNEVNIISTEESSVSPRLGVGGIYTIILQSMDRNRIKDYKLYVDGVYYSSWTDDDTTFQFDFTGDYLWFRAIISLYDPDQVTFDYTYDQMSYTTYELPGDFYLVDCGENSECDLTIIKKNENETINGFKFDDPEVKSVITDIKFISDEVTNMSKTFYGCPVLSGDPICSNSVIDMSSAYYQCANLTGSPVCGPKVTNMYETYYRCENLTGSPACGDKVTNMSYAYFGCENLTGASVCGDKVTNMSYAYYGCGNLTGDPVCENNVTNMSYAYCYCYSLTGSPICGPNVTDMSGAYHSCRNLSSNGYFYSNKIVNVCNCFYGRNTKKRLNLYVPANSTTLNTCLGTTYKTSLTGGSITWTDSVATNGCYYNTTRNIYIYPVANVAQTYENNR